jgi:hypothetical protein
MVLKSKIRGNGRQLAHYLLTKADNEQVRILDVDGRKNFSEQDVRDMLGDFSLAEKLTRSRQGIYHAVINPPADASLTMTDKQWLTAVDILAEEIGFSEQRRVSILHTKNGRQHLHVAFERINYETLTMLPISHNYRKQDKARARMEQVFAEQPTPKRNPHRPEMKRTLTALWKKSGSAKEFLKSAKEEGYMISEGFGRVAYAVVDRTGRSYNLIRDLEGVKVKEARERFRDSALPTEKEAIAFQRNRQGISEKKQEQKPQEAKNEFLENLARMKMKQQSQKLRMH